MCNPIEPYVGLIFYQKSSHLGKSIVTTVYRDEGETMIAFEYLGPAAGIVPGGRYTLDIWYNNVASGRIYT